MPSSSDAQKPESPDAQKPRCPEDPEVHLSRTLLYNENTPGVFVIIDKISLNEVARFTSEEFHSLHTINAFESKKENENSSNLIYFDSLRFYRNAYDAFLFPIMNVTGDELLDNYARMMSHPKPIRISLDLGQKKSSDDTPLKAIISEEVFNNAKDNQNWPAYMANGMDFPSVRPSEKGISYDEFYSSGQDSFLVGRVYKSKYSTMERWVWHEVGYHCAETAVVERPEDFEGDFNDSTQTLVITVCTPFSDDTGNAFFVVLDENLKELGRAYLPDGVKVPATLHTTFIPRSVEEKSENSASSVSFCLALIFLCKLFL